MRSRTKKRTPHSRFFRTRTDSDDAPPGDPAGEASSGAERMGRLSKGEGGANRGKGQADGGKTATDRFRNGLGPPAAAGDRASTLFEGAARSLSSANSRGRI